MLHGLAGLQHRSEDRLGVEKDEEEKGPKLVFAGWLNPWLGPRTDRPLEVVQSPSELRNPLTFIL